MFHEKAKLINQYGEEAELIDYVNNTTVSTKVVAGRISVDSRGRKLDAFKRLLFPPSVEVANGHYVNFTVEDTLFLITATIPEMVRGRRIAYRCEGVKCNVTLTVKGYEETADEYGNIKKVHVEKVTDLACYMESVSGELRQYDPGKYPDVEYIVYSPVIEVDLLDTLEVTIDSEVVPLKVVEIDKITHPGVLLISVKTETRGR